MMQRVLTGAVAIWSGALILLSFTPWLQVHGRFHFMGWRTFAVNGTEVQSVTTFGDGGLVAVLAAMVALIALASLVISIRRPFLGSVISASGLFIFGIALYDVSRDWKGSRHYPESLLGSEITGVETEPALFLTLVLGALIAMSGLALLIPPMATLTKANPPEPQTA